MTQSEIFSAFGGRISISAIRLLDDGWEIVGKWCRILRIGDRWDVFVCNPDDMYSGLSQRKVKAIIDGVQKRLREVGKPHKNGVWRVLDGEAYTQALDADQIVETLDLLGVRKARKLSVTQRQAMAKRMRKARSQRTGAGS